MSPDVLIGVLLGLLLASVLLNAYQFLTLHQALKPWKLRVQEADDARRGAELRSSEQIDAMLDRISTSPRIELRQPVPTALSDNVRYIPDTLDGDEAWNDYRKGDEE